MRCASDRRSFLQLVAGSVVSVVSARALAQPASSVNRDKWVDAPGEETAEVAALIDAAAKELERAAAPSAVLCDARYAQIHAFPRFRAAIKAHATADPLTIAAKDEPGERAVLKLKVVAKDGTPLSNALVYVYHTSAKGWYSNKAYHVRANSGDQRHARLFGYVRTDKAGFAELRSIRPGGYPDGNLPAHFHVEVSEPDGLVTEVVFSDDPRLTPDAKKRSIEQGFAVSTPVKGPDAAWRIDATITRR